MINAASKSGHPEIVGGSFCEKIIDRLTAHYVAGNSPAAAPVPKADPNWDHLANSFALAGDAIMFATFGLAVIVALGAIGWLVYVHYRTREEAKKEVARVAPAHVRAYLDENAPGMVAEIVATLMAGQSGTADGASADEQARDLGGEPR